MPSNLCQVRRGKEPDRWRTPGSEPLGVVRLGVLFAEMLLHGKIRVASNGSVSRSVGTDHAGDFVTRQGSLSLESRVDEVPWWNETLYTSWS